jgi:hypothetical protein
MMARSVNPQKELKQSDTSISNVLPAEAEFRHLIGTAMSGSVARFVGNELFVIFWHRTTKNPELVFGIEVDLSRFNLNSLVNNFCGASPAKFRRWFSPKACPKVSIPSFYEIQARSQFPPIFRTDVRWTGESR